MLHAGVCVLRQYSTFTAVPHGRKITDFFRLLLNAAAPPPRLVAITKPTSFTSTINRSTLRLATRIFASWNQLDGWLRRVEELRRAA
jgi:hypothetical protein